MLVLSKWISTTTNIMCKVTEERKHLEHSGNSKHLSKAGAQGFVYIREQWTVKLEILTQGQLMVCLFNCTWGFGLDLKDSKQLWRKVTFFWFTHLLTSSSLKSWESEMVHSVPWHRVKLMCPPEDQALSSSSWIHACNSCLHVPSDLGKKGPYQVKGFK